MRLNKKKEAYIRSDTINNELTIGETQPTTNEICKEMGRTQNREAARIETDEAT